LTSGKDSNLQSNATLSALPDCTVALYVSFKRSILACPSLEQRPPLPSGPPVLDLQVDALSFRMSARHRSVSGFHQRNPKIMYRLITFVIFVLISATISLRAQEKFKSEHDYLRDQEKAIEQANVALDGTYQRIVALIDGRIAAGDAISKKVKDTLITAERAWIKWRDAEAAFRGYREAEGGNAYLENLNANLLQLINQRKEFLQGWLAQ
jgi:uncharacterized protein YecT (DUF1311 family)